MEKYYNKCSQGFSTLEGLIFLGVVVLVFTMVVPPALRLVDASREKKAIYEIEEISKDVDQFYLNKKSYPDTLVEIYGENKIDPWGNPYEYLKISGAKNNSKGKRRKLQGTEINTDYDLYSMGKDEKSAPPLTANISRDDIIRGRNGKFIGQVTDF